MGQTLDKAKRRAAGHMMMTMFGLLNHLSYQLGSQIAGKNYERLGDGLTEKEVELVKKIASDLNKKAELCRQLGHRFHGHKTTRKPAKGKR